MKTTLALLTTLLLSTPSWAQTPDAITQAAQKIDSDLGGAQKLLADAEGRNRAISTCFPASANAADVKTFADTIGRARAASANAAQGYAANRQSWLKFTQDFSADPSAASICGASAATVQKASDLGKVMDTSVGSVTSSCDMQVTLAKKFHQSYGARTSMLTKADCRDAQNTVRAVERLLADSAKTCASLAKDVTNTGNSVTGLNRRLADGCEAAKNDELAQEEKAEIHEEGHEKFMACEKAHPGLGLFYDCESLKQ